MNVYPWKSFSVYQTGEKNAGYIMYRSMSNIHAVIKTIGSVIVYQWNVMIL